MRRQTRRDGEFPVFRILQDGQGWTIESNLGRGWRPVIVGLTEAEAQRVKKKLEGAGRRVDEDASR